MNAIHLFLFVLLIYIAFLVLTGVYFTKRQNSPTDFWLAGKSAGFLSIGFSAAASWITAGALLAVIGFYMLLGMGSIWGFVAPNILALFIIAFFVKKIKTLPAITQPELLELRYGNYLRLPVAIIITVVMILFAVADIKGFSMVLEVFYGISPAYSALIVGLAVAVYVTLGGLSAVIATDVVQFLCLSLFILVMAVAVMSGAGNAADMPWRQLLSTASGNWWNPASIGLPMILIFVLAIIPGWITEQDPWQRVWAAKDEKSARNGMLFGSLLVALVFGGCALIALGLNVLYPDITKAGFPMGMAQAEPALLTFIMHSGFSNISLAFCAVALAAAAMSCTDTFAASGASCISRDVFQRYLYKDATMKQMRRMNRISVLLIVFLSTLGSFFIRSIIDAIHIATFIASSSYFFVLMGGLYWKRATGPGAVASLWTGFFVQTGLVVFDLLMTPPAAPPYLESLHSIFMGHGVIIAMLISGVVFAGVSLATNPSEKDRLAPFFLEKAERPSYDDAGTQVLTYSRETRRYEPESP
jgi:solute:Na+ symporter, SSS family